MFFLVSIAFSGIYTWWFNDYILVKWSIFLFWVISGNVGGKTLGNFRGHCFNRSNHWQHSLVPLLFIMLIIKHIKWNIFCQILAVDNVDMSVPIWFLSKNFRADRTYFVVSNSVPFYFQVSAHVQVFYNVVFVSEFRNTAICWTVENIVEEWNLVFIVHLRPMIF